MVEVGLLSLVVGQGLCLTKPFWALGPNKQNKDLVKFQPGPTNVLWSWEGGIE
jgi:hypothetical protein